MRVPGFIALYAVLWLSACATVPGVDAPKEKEPTVPVGIIVAAPNDAPEAAPEVTSPMPPASQPPVDAPAPVADIPLYESPLSDLKYWNGADLRPALASFRRSCKRWTKLNVDDALNNFLPEYGTYGDWAGACELAGMMGGSRADARTFFENQFAPVPLKPQNAEKGLLTGYYQPELEVRRVPTPEFSEPILAVPTTAASKTLPRSKITPRTSRVIAYGRPLEVFFMQIQGSGHIRFKNGRTIRAAYAGNNGYPYTSIGGVLIRRGEVTKDQSGKRDLEAWMRKSGPRAARDLMNEKCALYLFHRTKN